MKHSIERLDRIERAKAPRKFSKADRARIIRAHIRHRKFLNSRSFKFFMWRGNEFCQLAVARRVALS